MKRLFTFLAFTYILSASFVGCVEEDNPASSNGGLSTDPVGSYTGTEDYRDHFTGTEYDNRTASGSVSVRNENQYAVTIRITPPNGDTFGPTVTSDNSGQVNYRSGNLRYVGSFNFGSGTLSGGLDAYQVNTDGSEILHYSYDVSLEKR